MKGRKASRRREEVSYRDNAHIIENNFFLEIVGGGAPSFPLNKK